MMRENGGGETRSSWRRGMRTGGRGRKGTAGARPKQGGRLLAGWQGMRLFGFYLLMSGLVKLVGGSICRR